MPLRRKRPLVANSRDALRSQDERNLSFDGTSESDSAIQGHTVAHGPRPRPSLPGSEPGGRRSVAGPIIPYPYPLSFASGPGPLSLNIPGGGGRSEGGEAGGATRRRLTGRLAASPRRAGPPGLTRPPGPVPTASHLQSPTASHRSRPAGAAASPTRPAAPLPPALPLGGPAPCLRCDTNQVSQRRFL